MACDEESECPGCTECGCSVCGKPVRWGSRHPRCGELVAAQRANIKALIDQIPDGNVPDVARFVRGVLAAGDPIR